MFRFILLLPDQQANDPPCLVTTVAEHAVGTEVELQTGDKVLVLETDTAISTHLRALGFSGILTVRPV